MLGNSNKAPWYTHVVWDSDEDVDLADEFYRYFKNRFKKNMELVFYCDNLKTAILDYHNRGDGKCDMVALQYKLLVDRINSTVGLCELARYSIMTGRKIGLFEGMVNYD